MLLPRRNHSPLSDYASTTPSDQKHKNLIDLLKVEIKLLQSIPESLNLDSTNNVYGLLDKIQAVSFERMLLLTEKLSGPCYLTNSKSKSNKLAKYSIH